MRTYKVGLTGNAALRWGEMKTEIAELRKAIADRDKAIRSLAERLYRKTHECNQLRRHDER